MKAIVQKRYGDPQDVFELCEIDPPRPAAEEVVVRVHATSVHADIWHTVCGRPMLVRLMGAGIWRPREGVPGTDLAGIVESLGEGASRFRIGDRVFGGSDTKLSWRNGGTFAELAAVKEKALELIPESATFEQAASLPTSGYIALLNLRGSASIRPGMRMLINGAGGAVGSIALQVAKERGATVTAVDRAEKAGMLVALGADRVVDFREEDVTRGSESFDLILDVASTLSLGSCRRVLRSGGVYLIIGHDHYGVAGGRIVGTLPRFFGLLARSPFDRNLPSISLSRPPEIPDVMPELKRLLEAGKLTPIIDRVYPLDEAREAMGYLQQGGGTGRIIVSPRK